MTEKKLRKSSFLPHLFRKPLGFNAWAQGSIVENAGVVYGKGYIHAPKQGDRAMAVLQREMRHAARKLGKPVTHTFVAANKGSIALIERTRGYTYINTDDDGNQIYEKTFYP